MGPYSVYIYSAYACFFVGVAMVGVHAFRLWKKDLKPLSSVLLVSPEGK